MTVTGHRLGPYPDVAPTRRTSRIVWSVVGLAMAVGAVSAWTTVAMQNEYWPWHRIVSTQRIFSDPVSALSVFVGDGQVKVAPSAGTTTSVFTSGTTTSAAPTNVEHLRHGVLTLTSVCTTGRGDCERNYVIHVPHGAAVSIHLRTGAIVVSGITGTVRANDADGPMVISDVAGTVDATTQTGSITVHGASGPLTLTSSDGDVTVNGASGPLTVTDATGRIRATGLQSTTVSASAGDGDVTLGFTTAPQRVRATSATGGVHVGLPPGSGPYQVHTTAATGRATTGVDSDPSASAVIDAGSQDGDVTVVYTGT